MHKTDEAGRAQATLILEEALKQIESLGFAVIVLSSVSDYNVIKHNTSLVFVNKPQVNLCEQNG